MGGLAEDVINGETGLLVPPASIGEVAAAIDRLLDDGDLAARMGDRARELSRTRFSWDEAASILEAAIAGIAGGARDGPPPRSSPAGDARAHSPA